MSIISIASSGIVRRSWVMRVVQSPVTITIVVIVIFITRTPRVRVSIGDCDEVASLVSDWLVAVESYALVIDLQFTILAHVVLP
jgi:hypothetical protein